MREKGTNELRVLISDRTEKVLNWKVGMNPDLSKNSIVCRVLDKWAEKTIMASIRKRDKATLEVNSLEIYGVDTASLRKGTDQ